MEYFNVYQEPYTFYDIEAYTDYDEFLDNLVLRSRRIADVETLRPLFNDKDLNDAIYPDGAPSFIDSETIDKRRDKSFGYVLMLLKDKIVGFVQYRPGKITYIKWVSIDWDFRGKGLCNVLMSFIFGRLREKNMDVYLYNEAEEKGYRCYVKGAETNGYKSVCLDIGWTGDFCITLYFTQGDPREIFDKLVQEKIVLWGDHYFIDNKSFITLSSEKKEEVTINEPELYRVLSPIIPEGSSLFSLRISTGPYSSKVYITYTY